MIYWSVLDSDQFKKSASTDALDPPIAEYDHVIRKRLERANQPIVHTDSSSDNSDYIAREFFAINILLTD